LDKSTETKLSGLIERIFVGEHLQIIFSNGFDSLIDEKNFECLIKLFYFLDRISKLDYLKKSWAYYIKQRGNTLISEQELSIEDILTFKTLLETILVNCFNKNQNLKSAMQFSIEDCINVKTNKIAELTSKHLDDILREAHKISDDETLIEKKLDEVISIFRYLSAKDVFEAFYTKRLVKRFLLGTSSSEELERRMLDKLKHECGANFTRKSEDIMKEFDISKNITTEFLESPG
jgi:cullin-4